ncbi:hypothetical protein EVAR_67405_1, partial [Eumeta japonica]
NEEKSSRRQRTPLAAALKQNAIVIHNNEYCHRISGNSSPLKVGARRAPVTLAYIKLTSHSVCERRRRPPLRTNLRNKTATDSRAAPRPRRPPIVFAGRFSRFEIFRVKRARPPAGRRPRRPRNYNSDRLVVCPLNLS